MNVASSRYQSAKVREDAYFCEIDRLLLDNLREALQLQNEAAECAAGDRSRTDASSREQLSVKSSRSENAETRVQLSHQE